MATLQIRGSFSTTNTAAYDDVLNMHADKEIVFWEASGTAYTVEFTVDGGTAVELDVAADANPYQILVSKAKTVSLRFKGASTVVRGYAS